MSNDIAPIGALTEAAVGDTEQPDLSAETSAPTVTRRDPGRPDRHCDVVMKGGIVSGVVYPGALKVIGGRYRIRGIGGASAGAIGAAVGAAAELGGNDGYRKLSDLPADLGEGRLAKLFQPSRSTRPLLRLMLTATGNELGGARRRGLPRVLTVVVRAIVSFPIAAVLGALAGIALFVGGLLADGWSRVLLIAAGVIVAVIGLFVVVLFRLYRLFTRAIPGNMFGICTGHVDDEENPGFTDWLADTIDDLSGLPQSKLPLRFGQLWTGSQRIDDDDVPAAQRDIDLRMITTCLSESRPYELPMEARQFFYEPSVWKQLFPARVMDALDDAPAPSPTPGADKAAWDCDKDLAQKDRRGFRRLPEAKDLPVIVAVRLSLSFPLLISAVPLWSVDRKSEAFRKACEDRESGVVPNDGCFRRSWFTDGGFCSNFPVHLFDAALPSRPTFAINLGRFANDADLDPVDQSKNIEWARSNEDGLDTPFIAIPDRGAGAIAGFASAAINTARNWQDTAQLTQPGYRDRVVRVLQTKSEGGLNLHMPKRLIVGLAARGKAAGTAITEQFLEPRYPTNPDVGPIETMDGWTNHIWVRYRALMASLPDWLASYQRGRTEFHARGVKPDKPPDYVYKDDGALSNELATQLDAVATTSCNAAAEAVDDLISAPTPRGSLRRTPRI